MYVSGERDTDITKDWRTTHNVCIMYDTPHAL